MTDLFDGLAHLGRYSIISADVPWAHANYGQAKHGAAKSNYEEMSIEDVERMPVGDLADPSGALLFLWSTGCQVADGAHKRVADAWGFKLVTRPFLWVKTNDACEACGHSFDQHAAAPVSGALAAGLCLVTKAGEPSCACPAFASSAFFGPGSYTGQNAEDVFLGVREGSATWSKDRARRDVRQILFAPAPREHSKKPETMQDRIEALWPEATARLELFARRRRPGWACWGGECPDPDLVFGADVGAWWPVSRPAIESPTPAEVSMFGGGP